MGRRPQIAHSQPHILVNPPPPTGLGLPCIEQLFVALLGARTELHVLIERLGGKLKHANRGLAHGVVFGEDGQDVARRDAGERNVGGEKDTLAKRRVGVDVDPSLALAMRAGSYVVQAVVSRSSSTNSAAFCTLYKHHLTLDNRDRKGAVLQHRERYASVRMRGRECGQKCNECVWATGDGRRATDYDVGVD